MTTTPSNPQRDALHAADVAMRDAWTAFADAYRARREAAAAANANVGEIRLDNSWGEQTLLRTIGVRIGALPKGEDLDAAIGRGILAERARIAAQQRKDEARAEAKARFDAGTAHVLAKLNERFQQTDAEREQALAALEGAK